MNRYVIEREIPGVGKNTAEGFCQVAKASNAALDKVGDGIQWQESFVVADKTFCVYLAENEDKILEHAKKSGFPATRIHQVRAVIDPTTANG
ncbi:MAG TPA: DUF4242 domain-containing protein [Thermoanaerobaculia bacterium]|nr:DUF4242 domain-containing protein [Thermoanaerobaculia bacterium]